MCELTGWSLGGSAGARGPNHSAPPPGPCGVVVRRHTVSMCTTNQKPKTKPISSKSAQMDLTRGFARWLLHDDPDTDHGIFNTRLSIPMVGLVGGGERRWVSGSGMHRKVVPPRFHLGTTGEIARASAHAPLLSLTRRPPGCPRSPTTCPNTPNDETRHLPRRAVTFGARSPRAMTGARLRRGAPVLSEARR